MTALLDRDFYWLLLLFDRFLHRRRDRENAIFELGLDIISLDQVHWKREGSLEPSIPATNTGVALPIDLLVSLNLAADHQLIVLNLDGDLVFLHAGKLGLEH